MKSERITFLASPEFKANLVRMASRQHTSVGEMIRARFERVQDAAQATEENELRALAADLRAAVAEARVSLREGLAETEATLAALRRTPAHKRARAA